VVRLHPRLNRYIAWRIEFAARLASRQADPPDATVDVWAALEHRIRPVLQHLGGGMIGTHSAQGDLLGVVTVREGTPRESAMRRIAEARGEGQGPGAASVALAAGAVVTDWGGLAEVLADAVDALDGPRLEAGWIDATLPSLPRLLSSLSSDPRMRSFTRRRLAPLDADTPRAEALRETAQALCAAGGHRADAARSLGIARQSLYRRIAALERVLGVDLDDPVALTELHVALLARGAGA
jgi:purine catabolism regulator